MQRARPAPVCDCTSETARTVHRIHKAAAGASGPLDPAAHGDSSSTNGISRPPPPSAPPLPATALDDVLGESRSLVRNWERMNGCVNAALHLDSDHATLQAMIGAVDRLVGLYDALGRAASLFAGAAQGRSLAQQQDGGMRTGRDSRASSSNSPGEWSSWASEPACATPDTSVAAGGAVMVPPSGGRGFLDNGHGSNGNHHVVGGVAVTPAQPVAYLGTHRLDDEEMVLVAREAVRHSVILLGELLHDIEKDFGEDLEESPRRDVEAVATYEAVSKVSARLLRLLGRINSSTERT